MATSAVHAFKTQIKKGSTWIVNSYNVQGVSLTRESIDATNMMSHDGSGGGYRERIPGLKSLEPVTFTIDYVPTEATHQALYTDLGDGSNDTYNLEYCDGGSTYTWSFSAFVSSIAINAQIDDKLTAEVTLQPTGAPTLPS